MSSPCFKIDEYVFPSSYIREYPGANLNDQEDTLNLHIKRYSPIDQPSDISGAVTIVAAHANGFCKELYEPLWEDLYRRLKSRGQRLRGIWIADAAHQGKSGILNEEKLGNDPCWDDHARDMLNMINHFRKEMPRPIVGVGHSMGANQIVTLSLMHPRLLSTVILIEPVIQDPHLATGQDITRLSTFRRDQWPSRTEALASTRTKFFQHWDKRVTRRWNEYAFRDMPTFIYPDTNSSLKGGDEKPVTLATTKHQEVFTYLRPNYNGLDHAGNRVINRTTHPDLDPTTHLFHPFYNAAATKAFELLPRLRPSTLYMFGGQSEVSSEASRKQKLERTGSGIGGSGGFREGRVKEVLFEDSGHLLPMEMVGDVADSCADWLLAELERWRKGEDEWKKQWAEKSIQEKTMITEEWKQKLGRPPKVLRQGKL